MPWTVSIRYESDKFPETVSGRSSTSHAVDPLEAIKQSLDKINRDRNGKPFTVISISVERQP